MSSPPSSSGAECVGATSEVALALDMLFGISEHEVELAERFYEVFFERLPEVVPLFGEYALAEREEMVGETLKSILGRCEEAPWLEANLVALGASHWEYGVTSEMYPVFVRSFVDTVAEILGPRYDEAAGKAFEQVLQEVCGIMQRAGEAAAAR